MPEQITITFPDGTEKEFPKGVTGREVAESISMGLAREALSITLDDEIMDLSRPIEQSGTITINTWDTEDGKYTFWHSSAHVLAEAIQELYPDAKFGIGPPVENGFYYDIDFGDQTISQDDLDEIEDKIIDLARNKETFERKPVSKQEALEFYQDRGNEYKIDLIEDLEQAIQQTK